MKTILIILCFSAFKVFASPAVETETSDCSDCSVSDVQNAVTQAESQLLGELQTKSNSKIETQENICNQEFISFQTSCAKGINNLRNDINTLNTNLATKISNANTNQSFSDEDSKASYFQQIVDALNELNVAIKSKKESLETLEKECNKNGQKAANMCVPPQILPHEIREKTSVAGAAVATAKLTQPYVPEAPSILNKRNEVIDRNFELIEEVKIEREVIDSSISQITSNVNRLRELLSKGSQSGGDGDGGFNDFVDEPSEGNQGNTPSSNPNTITPLARPSSGSPNPSNGGGSAGGDTVTDPGTTGGVSGADVIAGANNSAYGVGGSNGTDPGGSAAIDSSTPMPSGSSWFSRAGSVLNELTGLAPMFAKTNGGNNSGDSFGNDSSYASNLGNSRYGGAGNSGMRNQNPNNMAYQQNNKLGQKPGQLPNRPRSYGGYNPDVQGSNSFNNGGNGGGSLGLGSSSNGSRRSTNNEKPGLLSKLFGKKDKTLFGNKNTKGGSMGGYGGSTSGSSSGRSIYEDSSGTQYQKTGNGRMFDPNKYAPSKAAEAQAYARHTGRKIASHSSPSAYPAPISWPADISRNKKANMFFNISLQVKMTVDNTK